MMAISAEGARELTYSFPELGPEDRLRELIIYVAEKCREDPFFGATKLNKILYFSDFESFRRYGEPVTGADYMRLGYGPVPRSLVQIRNALLAAREIHIEKAQVFQHEQHRVIALRDADLSRFSARDISVVDEVIRVLWGKSAAEVSELSHGSAWNVAEDLESIPYEAAFLADISPSTEDITRALELVRENGWAL